MNISIDSQDLLDILLEAGIQTVDAKALILDILTLQENAKKPPEQKPTAPAAPTAPAPKHEVRTQVAENKVYGDTVQEDQEGHEEEEEQRPAITRVQGKSVNGSRPKFDGFGGDSTGALRR